jgi:hypothetical protein
MKKIGEVLNLKAIQLKNTKVKFVVKLLQYRLNTIIYRYNPLIRGYTYFLCNFLVLFIA